MINSKTLNTLSSLQTQQSDFVQYKGADINSMKKYLYYFTRKHITDIKTIKPLQSLKNYINNV